MTYVIRNLPPVALAPQQSTVMRDDPRALMHQCLPGFVQPLLTWLTARPAPGEAMPERSAAHFVVLALAETGAGVALSWVGVECPLWLAAAMVPLGLILCTSGLGLFQVVVFHHCSHGTVFRDREMNIRVGRLISAVLLFKHFDVYKRQHMLHHSPNKLLTEEDEFADFVFGMCGLTAGMPKRALWRKVLVSLVSPVFHLRFAWRRACAAMHSHDRLHNATSIGVWAALFGLATAFGQLRGLLVAWVLPLVILLQVATVFRILCEHRFPDQALIQARGRDFPCHATSGVFPGMAPPGLPARSWAGGWAWLGWWANMLTIQLLVRVLILVGDAPCHDYHHRRPASRRWTSYIHARQIDIEAGSPGFRVGYNDTWGLFHAVDESLASLARTPNDAVWDR